MPTGGCSICFLIIDQYTSGLYTTLSTCRDNLRGFFEQNFPNLLRNIFGFDGQGWLASAAQVDGVDEQWGCTAVALIIHTVHRVVGKWI